MEMAFVGNVTKKQIQHIKRVLKDTVHLISGRLLKKLTTYAFGLKYLNTTPTGRLSAIVVLKKITAFWQSITLMVGVENIFYRLKITQ